MKQTGHIMMLLLVLAIPAAQARCQNKEKSKSLITPLIIRVQSSANAERIAAAAFPFNENEYIVGMDTSDESMSSDSLALYFSSKKNNIWQVPELLKIARYPDSYANPQIHYCGGPEIVRTGNSTYISLSYNSSFEEALEHVEILLDLKDRNVTYGIFEGKRLNGRKIEGRLKDFTEGVDTVAAGYISTLIDSTDYLVSISQQDALSDSIMNEWKSVNVRAEIDAAHIDFIPIPEESSMSEAYASRKYGKETSGRYTATLMNFRRNTIICVSDSEGRSSLVWCEPQCRDRTSGKYLHTIFFEQKAVLALFYYHGRKSYKYRINLDTGKIAR